MTFVEPKVEPDRGWRSGFGMNAGALDAIPAGLTRSLLGVPSIDPFLGMRQGIEFGRIGASEVPPTKSSA